MFSPSRSGTFDGNVDDRVGKFTESIGFDQRLYEHDIAGSIAHANMLAKQGLLTPVEAGQITTTLATIRAEIHAGEFQFRSQLEDIHMNIEQALIDRLGDVGRKLHTGRSRNDQASTDLRLWIRAQIDLLDIQLASLQMAFVDFAERESTTVIPAYTHLQRAQPVLAAHYALAFCEKFDRDRERLLDCRRRVNRCGLGTAAVAGTSLPIDRVCVAKELIFVSLALNSIYASGDRDFVLEYVFCLSVIAIHLSNWAEDWIIWSTTEFNFISLPHEFCTGSSIMPQKINPDVLELIRGKTSRVIGNLQTLLVLVKGLPTAYNRDLQEDKPALFDAHDTVCSCLEMAIAMVQGARFNSDSISNNIEQGFLDATTMMEYLIKQGMPQRNAHYLIGQLVRLAMNENSTLAELSLSQLQALAPQIDESVYGVLGVKNAISAFQSVGSTATDQVAEQVRRWKQRLNTEN